MVCSTWQLGITVELRRPRSEQSPATIERWRYACSLAIDEMQRALAELPEPFSLTHIAIACACGYLDFRPGDGSYDRFPKAERRSNVDIRRP